MATPLSIPVRPTGQPQWPFGVNWDSWEAQGLKTWIPLGTAPIMDLVGGGCQFYRGNVTNPGSVAGRLGYWGSSRATNLAVPPVISIVNKTQVNFVQGFPITVSCWVQWYRVGLASTIIGLTQAPTTASVPFSVSNTNNLTALHTSSAGVGKTRTTNDVITAGVPYHLAWTDDDGPSGTTLHIYINGVECSYSSTTNATGTPTNTFGPFNIGASISGNNPVVGVIADVRLYNYPMSAYQIGMLYENMPKYDLYQRKRIIISVPVTSTFLPRLAVLGAG